MMPKLSVTVVLQVLLHAFVRTEAEKTFSHDATATTLAISDDSLEAVTLNAQITIKGTVYTQLYISENGMVTTEDGFYGGLSFPSNKPWIAPFGTDIIPGAGTVIYQQFSNADTLHMDYASLLVNEVYKGDSFIPLNALVVTWMDVFIRNGGKENTFQLILAYDASRLYAIFIYESIQFLPVQIGASAGDDVTFYKLCYTDKWGHMKNLVRMSNSQCGRSGVLVFRLDENSWNGANYVCSNIYTPIPCRTRPGVPENNYAARCPSFVLSP